MQGSECSLVVRRLLAARAEIISLIVRPATLGAFPSYLSRHCVNKSVHLSGVGLLGYNVG